MRSNFFQETLFGIIIRKLSNKKFLKHSYETREYVSEKSQEYSGLFSLSLDIDISKKQEIIEITWDNAKDPENPKNWSTFKQSLFCFQVSFLTLAVYLASAIYVPGIEDIQEAFNVGHVAATLPLTLFVFGYGFGPMIFSPISENAEVGRMPLYISSLLISVLLQIPLALAHNFAGLCILRFLTGVFASPCLSIGPAAVCDVLSVAYGPIGIGLWSVAAVSGPSFGPLIGSVLVVKTSWRWTFWILCILDGFALVLAFFFFPETNENALLHRKAVRLRKMIGNENIVSRSELTTHQMTLNEKIIDTLWRPIEITIREPMVFMVHIYLSLVYAIMYLWFECFPIVFQEVHNFSLVLTGVAYMGVIIGSLIGSIIYTTLTYHIFTRKVLRGEDVRPEVFIPMTIFSAMAMSIGVFIFGWTASPSIHWVFPIIGSAIFSLGAFITFQALFNYLAMSFLRFVASVFAGNALFRSFIGGALPLVGRRMFLNLGPEKFPVGWGCSIMGFIAAAMVSIPILFNSKGSKLRARSKYAD